MAATQQHTLRKRPPAKHDDWLTRIGAAEREEAKRLAEQARSEAAAARRGPAEEQEAAPMPLERSTRPATITAATPALNQAKFDKFVELVDLRMPKALTELENIKFLSSKERYDYLPEHGGKIVAALRRAVDEIEAAFAEEGKRRPRKTFNLLE